MVRPASEHPTDLELQILKVLWAQSPQTARQVREELKELGRQLAHTSVITTLQKMVDKGQLKQLDPTEGKAFRFSPRVKEQRVAKRMLTDLMQRVFNGSPEAVMLSLFEANEIDAEVVKRLRDALGELEQQKES